MIFTNFGKFIKFLNVELEDFIDEFINERKRLAKLGRRPKRILFAYDEKKDRNWAINEGGGIEIQYHIAIDKQNLTIYYGLGFNTQYVQFANEKSMVEYSKPYMDSFLINFGIIKNILPEYDYIIGDRNQLIHPKNDQYTLFGKEVNFNFNNGEIEISDDNLKTIFSDLKNQFEAYKLVFEHKNMEIPMETELLDAISILNYKKQIILQGSPGTGKTRLAKEIAKKRIPLTKEFIHQKVIKNIKIPTVKGNAWYIIKDLDLISGSITLEREKGTLNTISIDLVINYFNSERWNNEIDNNDDRMATAVAKFLYDNFLFENSQFKIIQFHPSYTYEDFVRGIVAESNGRFIEYKTINKVLGEFAEKANKNYLESQNPTHQNSKKDWVEIKFSEFVEKVQEVIDTKGEYRLTDKVKVVDTDENAFYYTGDEWYNGITHRMKFSDIIEAYFQNPVDKKTFKNLQTISGSAKQHYGYYYKILEKFRESIIDEFTDTSIKNIVKKDYFLVIDEINRANLPSVLGELIYALEYRNEEVESMYKIEDGTKSLILPDNLYIIGTMNTADRSVGHIDYAIRRRFAFVDVLPKVLNDVPFEKVLFEEVSKFFVENINDKPLKRSEHLSSEFNPKDVWLGHSYFIKKDGVESSIRLEYEIKPILEEYLKDGILIDNNEIRNKIENLHTFLS